MKSKIYRCNCRKAWSIQNRKLKTTARTILLHGEWAAELKPDRKTDPKGFIATNQTIIMNPEEEVMVQFEKVAKLLYDKERVDFNIPSGKDLYFAEDGACYIIRKRKNS
ncbi:hypothetical protein [Neobacillus fumarioli]|uniref:hypothetical protein n=1 Tax=Neobacillus fumarioli TaxID=105229 RepID=UPI0008304AB7|nr:hypothetical protein [Neobacillus fumarioli]